MARSSLIETYSSLTPLRRGLTAFPWWLKIGLKMLAVSLTPYSYEDIRARFTGFRGKMSDLRYAEQIFGHHLSRYKIWRKSAPEGNYLELGPGGSLASGLLARCAGFDSSTLIDAKDCAIRDLSFYRQLAGANGAPHSDEHFNFDEFMTRNSVTYLTEGLGSLKSLASGSISFSSSQDVLEHIRRTEFEATLHELFRVHRPGTVSSHRIDFKDHLAGSLNHLRFPGQIWENRLFPSQGFYTNRLRYSQMKDSFMRTGFEILDETLFRWDEAPLAASQLAPEFRGLSEDDLLIHQWDLVVRIPGSGK